MPWFEKPKKTHHCTGCRNLMAYSLDTVDENCCTCCTDADGKRPGRGCVASD